LEKNQHGKSCRNSGATTIRTFHLKFIHYWF